MGVPKISCLTITRERPEMLRRAIDYYARQTWPNKELVVVVDSRGDTEWVEPFFASLGRHDIRVTVSPPIDHIGALRNQSVALAAGELVATWDDDDLYHPRRLQDQAEAMLEKGAWACFLTDSLEYFEDAGELFFLDWKNIGLAPTMVAVRARLPRYPEQVIDPKMGEKGEDTEVQMALLRTGKVVLLGGHAHLYTRIYHGRNIWNRWHHQVDALDLSPESSVLEPQIADLAPRLREYFPGPLPDGVVAKDGVKVLFPKRPA